ncbi:hypothetical protein LJC18_03805 [Lachnospiraceae bacterium OttesenSCG-928-E19]|nr:hypothetical protein [Lachnospiraceae bacterium OttesenSCG-928-E19]
MLLKKNYIIVGLTAYHHEFLRISVPAVARLKQKVFLVIYNDNPDINITKSQITDLGYRGPVHIINTHQNVGTLKSKLEIVDHITQSNIKSDWMVFVNESDILMDVDIPNVTSQNYAVLLNKAIINDRPLDLIRAMDDPHKYIEQNHTKIVHPYGDINGAFIRTNIITDMDKTNIIDNNSLLAGLGAHARTIYADAAPIYMDRINYIAIEQ